MCVKFGENISFCFRVIDLYVCEHKKRNDGRLRLDFLPLSIEV